MKLIKNIILASLVVTLAFTLGASGTVLAHEVEGEAQTATTVTKQQHRAAHQAEKVAEREKQRAEKVAERQEKRETRRDESRKNVCQSRKQGLTNKFNRISTNAQRTQTRIDGIYAKALAYQQTNNLQPAGFDALVVNADTAKTASAASVANLKSSAPSIDCNNASVSNDVAAFKALAQTARDNLKSYKTAVKAVLQALSDSKPAETEGSAN